MEVAGVVAAVEVVVVFIDDGHAGGGEEEGRAVQPGVEIGLAMGLG